MLNLNCVICAELFVHSDDVHVTTCGHMFHFVCLKQWMERSKSCPQCRNKCTDRNIIRIYFNVANLDVSRVDVCSLQDQLDNANLKIKIKEKDLSKAAEEVKTLKDTQKKCMKTIAGLEQKLQKNEFLILSYTEQMKLLKVEAKIVDDLRKEVKSLKEQIETMEGVSSLLTSNIAESEKLLKNESDPKKLAVWVTTLKRELRVCETKKSDLRIILKVVKDDLRKQMEINKTNAERISQLESENYQLNEKIKTNEAALTTTANNTNNIVIDLENPLSAPAKEEQKRFSISPRTKDNIKKIEESNSPYLNIKSSSVGLVPLFKRHHETHPATADFSTKTTTHKLATLKISPKKSSLGALRKTSSDLSEKYSIFKKPRLGLAAAAASAGSASLLKPLGPNYVSNGFGGSERIDPFLEREWAEEEVEEENTRRSAQLNTPADKDKQEAAWSKANAFSLSNRLKAGGLRNFKIAK